MMRAIVFATVISVLIIPAKCGPGSLREEEESTLPKQIAEILKALYPRLDIFPMLMRQSRSSSRCPDGPMCFVALMGKRSMKRTADRSGSTTTKILQDLQNNLTPQYDK